MQKLFIAIIIFASLTAIGFSFRGQQVNWFWGSRPIMGLVLMLVAFGFASLWYQRDQKAQERKMQQIVQSLEQRQAERSVDPKNALSEREKVVLQLIEAGKSNKEITAELHVELSTVKTHINNIYKTLQVKGRKDIYNT